MFESWTRSANSVYFIGDIHANFDKYRQLIRDEYRPTIQVGDLGIGFNIENQVTSRYMEECSAKFIRGNHDNPSECATMESLICDGSVETILGYKAMFVGGALSIDKDMRTPGLDWWPDEQVTIKQAYDIYDLYVKTRPDLMVTHDIPGQALEYFEQQGHLPFFKTSGDITKNLLTEMFKAYQPTMWIFGHYHKPLRATVNGCKFVGLGIEEVFELKPIDLYRR